MGAVEDKVNELEKVVSERSFAYDLLTEFKALNKRMFTIIIVLLFLWFSTIAGFVGTALWFLDTYEMTSYELSTEGGGNANYVGNDMEGDINNGESKSKENNKEEEKEVTQSMGDENATAK